MNSKYKYILKKKVCNKVRKIYIKINSKSKKQYLKYKGKMINIIKYKKIINKKNNKKSKNYSKNIKRKKHKKKGGVYHPKYYELMSKLKSFIQILEITDKHDIDGIFNAFLNIYTKIKNRHENHEESTKELFDFLTILLIYLNENYKNLSNYEYRNILEKIKQLLLTLDENAITGIFNYSPRATTNPYTITDITNFQTIEGIIHNFRDNHKKVIWNIFIPKGKSINYVNVIICNTDVAKLISIMLSRNGLSNYIEKYKSKSERFKPY